MRNRIRSRGYRVYEALVFLGILFAAALLHAVATTIMLVLARVSIEEIGIGLGPRLLRLHIRKDLFLRFNLLLPIGAYVKFHQDQSAKLGRYGAAGLSLISPGLISLLIAVSLIGIDETVTAARHGVITFFVGAAMPWSVGAETWRSIGAAIHHQPFAQTVGIMFGVIGVLNLLPIPGCAGYQAVSSLLRDPRQRRDEEGSVFETLGILLLFLLMLSWLVALGIEIIRTFRPG